LLLTNHTLIDLCQADKGSYQRVGEATELALRVLTEKIGLLGYGSQALDSLSRAERATYCNDHWQHDYRKVCKLFLCCPVVLAEQSQQFVFEPVSALHSAHTHTTVVCKECECHSDRMLLLHCKVSIGAA
jgi:hypothetical protein